MVRSLQRVRRQDGATAVEYSIMVALIAAVIVLVVLYLGQQVKSGYCDTQTNMTTANIQPRSGSATSDC